MWRWCAPIATAVFVPATSGRYNFDPLMRNKSGPHERRPRKPKGTPGRGRPPIHHESWSKISVVLFDRQVVHLDRVAADARARNGKVLNRAEIIRALIDGLIDSGMYIAGGVSVADLRSHVASRLGTPLG